MHSNFLPRLSGPKLITEIDLALIPRSEKRALASILFFEQGNHAFYPAQSEEKKHCEKSGQGKHSKTLHQQIVEHARIYQANQRENDSEEHSIADNATRPTPQRTRGCSPLTDYFSDLVLKTCIIYIYLYIMIITGESRPASAE
jgi:hypothetical protein